MSKSDQTIIDQKEKDTNSLQDTKSTLYDKNSGIFKEDWTTFPNNSRPPEPKRGVPLILLDSHCIELRELAFKGKLDMDSLQLDEVSRFEIHCREYADYCNSCGCHKYARQSYDISEKAFLAKKKILHVESHDNGEKIYYDENFDNLVIKYVFVSEIMEKFYFQSFFFNISDIFRLF